MSVDESFPDKYKSDSSQRNLVIGEVLRFKVKDTNPPKIKRFVIIGFSEDKCTLASVYINSEINRKINWSLEQQELQVELTPEGRNYLTKTSYIDCSKLIIRECEEIVKVLENRPESIIGKLDKFDLNVVVTKLKEARTIKGKIKKKYGLFDL